MMTDEPQSVSGPRISGKPLISRPRGCERLSLVTECGSAKARMHSKDYTRRPFWNSFMRGNTESFPTCTIVTWDIERATRPEAIVEALQGPLKADICMLQGADCLNQRRSSEGLVENILSKAAIQRDSVAESEQFGPSGAFVLAFERQMIVSRFLIQNARIVRFRHQPHNWGSWWKPRLPFLRPRRGGRMALVAELQWEGSRLVLYNTYLGSQGSEHDYAMKVGEILDDLWLHYRPETPVVIAGDFGTKMDYDSAVRRLLETAEFHDVLEIASGAVSASPQSRQRRGCMFVRSLERCEAQIHALKISDHFPTTSTLAMAHGAKLARTRRGELRGEGRSNEG